MNYKKVSELREIAEFKGLPHKNKLKKAELISFIMEAEENVSPDYVPKSKYFNFLSGLTSGELYDLAMESENFVYKYASRAELISLFDERCTDKKCAYYKLIMKPLRKWILPDALRAWVGLFVSDDSVAEHYAQIILRVLSPMNCFGREEPVVRIVRKRKRKKRLPVLNLGEDWDLPDGW
jgi:hypothetical protein